MRGGVCFFEETEKKMNFLFDMDGVLVNSEPVILAAAVGGLKEYGVQAVKADFKPFIGAGEDRFVGGVAEKYGVVYRLEMKHRVYEKYLELVDNGLEVYPGTLRVLTQLNQAGHTCALASSADFIKIDANLRVAGIEKSVFKAIVGGEEVKHKKPFPDIYLLAAERIGARPESCIVVEDAVNGIQAAKAAGMKSVAVATSFPRELLEREQPDYIIDDLGELPDLFHIE
jgi:HAD superfamily hydrolase (TIGR01509 family)